MHNYDLRKGCEALLISMPHTGLEIPEGILQNMTAAAEPLADTDWHMERLYDFAIDLDVSIIRPRFSRYVIDLNRPPDDTNLYPGANSTELCPTSTFAEEPLYKNDCNPDKSTIKQRLETYWHPYHRELRLELARIKERCGVAILLEAHSIRSQVPRLFEGRLPDLNLGTASGTACAQDLQSCVETTLHQQQKLQQSYSVVVNQRFKGGYITRTYGQPEQGIHALQLELSQHTYMNESAPFNYRSDLARQIQPLLNDMVETMLKWARSHRDSLQHAISEEPSIGERKR